MRIGFDTKRAFYNSSGLGNYSRNIIEMMNNYYPENEYILYSPEIPNKLPKFAKGSNIFLHQANSKNKIRQAYWRSFTLGKHIANDKVDVYHGLSNELPNNIKKSKTPFIVSIHDLIFLRYPQFYKKWDVRIYHWKTRNACKNANKIIAVSEFTKNEIIYFFGIPEKKIEVIYQNCSPNFYKKLSNFQKQQIREKHQLPEDYILSVGTIEGRKNALLILEALVKFNLQVPILLVGRATAYKSKLVAYAKKHKLLKLLHFKENIANEDLPAIYQMAKIFVYPSVFEGFGIPVLEALHSGVPVITSNTSSLPEAAGIGSILINPYSVDELGEAISEVLGNEIKRNEMVSMGYLHTEKFLTKNLAPKIMKAYKQLY